MMRQSRHKLELHGVVDHDLQKFTVILAAERFALTLDYSSPARLSQW